MSMSQPPRSGLYQPVQYAQQAPTAPPMDEKYMPMSNNRRYCCGLFSSRKGCLWCFIPCCVFILIAIALILFFCIPREPNFDAYGVSYTNQTTVKLVNGGPFIQFNLGLNVSLYSLSYYPTTLASIDVTGAPVVNGQQSKTLAVNGTNPKPIYLPSFTNVSTVIPFTVIYNASSVAAALADPLWGDLFEACGLIPLVKARPLQLAYSATGSLQGLEFIKATKSGSYNYTCVITASEVTAIFGTALATLGL
ncbi:hypothetical protein SmJEL517_g02504 [Synchytrium microbalum]|uniref:Late embryogenesis abundant protein LEA-2 subgroup domain-containing protein n=1 Tax=Synchytrium microbalum TaxID=1806994 RepID=A0A507C0L8_9FUNG|nr:uncharacterized protein SmJEL517_g02504 [Synchytrium microbalum]TPX35080.1 hypothetical protein SmJEL517_g02504 [Synchytrium microbalum]